MKRVRYLLVLIAGIISGIIISCGTLVKANDANSGQIHIWHESTNGPYEVMRVVDDVTGANYIAVGGANSVYGFGITITPRLNPDGTVYTDKQTAVSVGEPLPTRLGRRFYSLLARGLAAMDVKAFARR